MVHSSANFRRRDLWKRRALPSRAGLTTEQDDFVNSDSRYGDARKHLENRALEGKMQISQFARIAQNYAVQVSDFVRLFFFRARARARARVMLFFTD